MATLKELREKYPDASMDEIKRLADKQNGRNRRPVVNLHSYHKFAAVGFLMGFMTFMGITIIKKENLIPVLIILILLAAAEVMMGILFFKAIKDHRIQQEDELARQLMNKAGKLTAATLLVIGGILEIVFSIGGFSFAINASNIGCLLFAAYCLVNGLKSLYFVMLDRVDGEDEE